METQSSQQAKVEAALQLQQELEEQLHLGQASIDDLFLDADKAADSRKEEEALDTICQRLFLSSDKLQAIVENGEKGEAARQILANVADIAKLLAEKGRITFGEKRYMDGLLEGLSEYRDGQQLLAGLARGLKEQESVLQTLVKGLDSLTCAVDEVRQECVETQRRLLAVSKKSRKPPAAKELVIQPTIGEEEEPITLARTMSGM
jgi:hypothetical protein